MSKPEITHIPGAYKFYWYDERLHCLVENISRGREGHYTAQLTFQTEAPGFAPFLHQSVLNLHSLRSRKEWASHLRSIYPHGDWNEIMEQICYHTLRLIREGEPVRTVGAGREKRQRPFLLYPILPLNLPTLIYGEGGVMKSYLALFIGLTVQGGIEELGWRPQQGNVLYLDYETDEEEVDYRIKMLKDGMLWDQDLTLTYRHCAIPLAEDLHEIRRVVLQEEIKLLIVDSVGAACGGDLTSAQIATTFFTAIRQLPITPLLISHVAKETTEKEKTPFGSVYFYNYARNVYQLVKHEEEEDEMTLGLWHKKCNFGKKNPPVGFTIKFTLEGVTFTREDISEIPDAWHRLSVSTKILGLLKHGPRSAPEIAEELGVKEDVARVSLNRLAKKNKIIRVNNKWGLKANEPLV